MTALAVTNTFASGATITAAGHNTNYSDIATYINNRNAGSSTWDALSVSSATNVPGIFNNSTGTQDILRCQDNGTNVLLVPNGGIITMASQSAARVYNTATQAISDSTFTKCVWDTEAFDVAGEFASNKFVAGVAGKYFVTAKVLWAALTDAKSYIISIYQNGASISTSLLAGAMTVASPTQTSQISDILTLSATDYLEVFVWQNTGGSVNLSAYTTSGAPGCNQFSVHKIA